MTTTELAAAEELPDAVCGTSSASCSRNYDHLLTPCMAVPPFPVEQNYPDAIAGKPMQTYIDWIAPTFVLSLTGLPVASVPAGLDSSGLPVGLQIAGKQFGRGKRAWPSRGDAETAADRSASGPANRLATVDHRPSTVKDHFPFFGFVRIGPRHRREQRPRVRVQRAAGRSSRPRPISTMCPDTSPRCGRRCGGPPTDRAR